MYVACCMRRGTFQDVIEPANCIRFDVGYSPTHIEAYLYIDTSLARAAEPGAPVAPNKVAKPGTYTGFQILAAVGIEPGAASVYQYDTPGVGAIR